LGFLGQVLKQDWLSSNTGLDFYMDKQVLVIGSSPAGLQAAQDLASAGLPVNLIESSPFIGSDDRCDLPEYLKNSKLLEILKDPGIKVWTNTDLDQIIKTDAGYQVQLQQNPRYIDLNKCTACGDCLDVCPVTIPGTDLPVIHFGGQPDCAVIVKDGVAPCSNACPAGIHVQGYVALINQGRYQEAYQLIYEDLPFPSVCGRVCNHYCEQACNRSQMDDPVNLMALKRFVADWAFAHPDQVWEGGKGFSDYQQESSGKKIAVIGAGPAGLTAARDLVRKGHKAIVFDNQSSAGGMMRVGIPPHRLPYQQLEWEIEQILSEGVELSLNTWVDDIPALLDNGFDAVLIATGAHQAVKVDIEGSDHLDNWLSLEFLRKACLGEKINLTGRKVIVLGGGDVAMDAARVAVRLGTSDVNVVCRGMRASFNEIKEAEEEGIEILRGRVFQRIAIERGKITGVECLEAEVGEVVDGKRQFKEIEGTAHLIEGDLVIWALGQRPDFSFLPEDGRVSVQKNTGIDSDDQLMTSLKGVFTAGDVHRGTTFFVVDAVGDGHRAAASIHNYLLDQPAQQPLQRLQEVNLTLDEMQSRFKDRNSARRERLAIPCLEVEERLNNFNEVDLGLKEKDALRESARCLASGPCSECMACVEVCQTGAIDFNQIASGITLQVSAVLSDQDAELRADSSGVIHFSTAHPMAGSAAAYEVIRELPNPVSAEGIGIRPSSRKGSKTGLILCQCGGEISRFVNTAALCKEAIQWPEVDFSSELAYSCTDNAGNQLKKIIKEQGLGRLVLAACSCCSLDQVCYSCTYQRLRCKDNLGVFDALSPLAELEFINIREQCAWVHRRSKKKATAAARNLIRASLARKPVSRGAFPDKALHPLKALVLGKGVSAGACLEGMAELGLTAASVEVLSGDVIRSGGKYQIRENGNEIQADCLILAPGSGAELDHISGFLKLRNQNPLISREHLERDALDLGLVLCPPHLDPVISGKGAAARIYAWWRRIFTRDHLRSAEVDWTRCRACGTCQDICGFGIPEIMVDDKGTYAVINPFLCQDCGLCTAHCPTGAITPATHTWAELNEMLELILD
jgi:NADPH-dependent glutamate synthase beta subunit-like oxidoreductase